MDASENMLPDHKQRQNDGKDRLSHLDLAEYNLRFTLELIRFADRKAQNLMRITLALLTATFLGVPPAVWSLRGFATSGDPWRLALFIVTVILYVACSACLLGSTISIVRVIRPRRDEEESPKCAFFFDTVAQTPLEDFLRMLREMDYDSAVAELGTQLHASAKIARTKYANVDAAVRWLLNGVLVGIVFALILLIVVGLLLPSGEPDSEEKAPEFLPKKSSLSDAKNSSQVHNVAADLALGSALPDLDLFPSPQQG